MNTFFQCQYSKFSEKKIQNNFKVMCVFIYTCMHHLKNIFQTNRINVNEYIAKYGKILHSTKELSLFIAKLKNEYKMETKMFLTF